MYIAEVISKGQQGKSYTSILLRESFRVGSAVKSQRSEQTATPKKAFSQVIW